jgi:hypothetical protein
VTEFEERADQLSLDDINSTLSDGQIFKAARRKLLAKGAKLLVGPRGTGKTHLMRFTYFKAIKDSSAPLVAYANFSRYLSLEPLLKRSPDALKRFHSWVIARLLVSAFDLIRDMSGEHPTITPERLTQQIPLADEDRLRELVGLLERSDGVKEYEDYGRQLTVNHVTEVFNFLAKKYGRSRTVLLLDDAALSLAEDYLVAFFEIYRLLKTEYVAPKASVYPGSTQYGPTFHASHEVEEVQLWLSVEDPEYLTIMQDIGNRRLASLTAKMSQDTLDYFKYVAFGSPRAYLRMLRDFSGTPSGSIQQRLNKIAERHVELVGAEYDSLAIKLKQFASIIRTGRQFIDSVVKHMASGQDVLGIEKNVVFGLQQSADRTPLAERMLRFLVEVGLLYPLNSPVSHGRNRRYDRYIVHLGFLQVAGAFRSGRGTSAKDLPLFMQRPSAKHPIRGQLGSFLSGDEISHLVLDLPSCRRCKTARINESQLFCHNCGEQLVVSSLFEDCMKIPLENVPGMSSAQVKRVISDTKLRTVGDVYASQSPSADLQRASYIGPVRAGGIVDKVSVVVNEFLS